MQINYLSKILLHIGIGISFMTFVGIVPKIYFFFIIIYFLVRIVLAEKPKKRVEVLKACAYIVSIEVLFRMTNAAIFYEASKYLVILFVLVGLFYDGISNKGYAYFIYLILLVPSIIVASTNIGFDANFRTNIAFVLSGPVCLGISALYCLDRKISKAQMENILLHLALPVVSLTTYLFLYSPSIKNILRGTTSNFAASGGFGPNQVCSVLGIGMFVFCVFIFQKNKNFLVTIINALIFAAITFRAIVTFSRGGVFTAIIMIIAFLGVLYLNSKYQERAKIIVSLILVVAVLGVTWMISSSQTYGLIDKRYNNQDKTGKVKDDVSAGRVDLFVHELEGFVENPFLGVGANGMKEMRIEKVGRGIASHNELSRVLSEHGLMGIFILLILIIRPLVYRSQHRGNLYFFSFLCFWFATINHSAMRIAAPGFIYGLALLYVYEEKRTLHRKRVIQ